MTTSVATTPEVEPRSPASAPEPCGTPAIGAHRLLSNGRCAALVRADTEIDWWCAPRFDATPVLWRLLDPAGAAAKWDHERPSRVSDLPAGATATTWVHTGAGALECRDGLVPVEAEATALVRLVRAVDAPCQATHTLTLGGFESRRATWAGGAATLDGLAVSLVGTPPVRGEGSTIRHVIDADAAWRGFAVVIGAHGAVSFDDLVSRLDEQERASKRSQERAVLPEPHPERAKGALTVLEACTYAPTGAVIASPTASLPEAVGGDRQWDYRFSWLRDAALAVAVAARLGHRHAADRYLAFVCSLMRDGAPPHPVVTIDGGRVPDERVAEGVAGWGGSSPVRLGNEAARQTQHDAFGLLLEAVSVYLRTGGRLRPETWSLVRGIADHVASCTQDQSNGIWEIRESDEFVSGDIGKWLALDRAIRIARRHRPWTRRAHWAAARDEVRSRVLSVLRDDGSLPQTFRPDDERSDAAALMLVIFGLLDRKDPRATAVVEAVLRDLGADPFVYRYRPDGADGFAPGEGAFVPTCWWAVSALATIGRVDEAVERLDALCARLPDLLSEEFDPVEDIALGNVPLVWSHTELARALYVLDTELRRKRWTTAGLAIWRAAHHARLRLSLDAYLKDGFRPSDTHQGGSTR